jgi:hypothetical protein
MDKKPLFPFFMSLILMLIAVSFPVQIAIMFDYNLFEIKVIFSKLTPLNFIVMILLTYTSFLTFRLDAKVFILLPFLNLFVFLNNFIVAEYGQIYGHLQTFLVSTLFLLFSVTYYKKDIYNVYHDLRFRYWLTSPRFNKNLPIEIHHNGVVIKSETFDISKTGLFIKADICNNIFNIDSHQNIEVIIIDNKRRIKISAHIMRKCMAQGHYPAGIGVKLDHTEETFFWNKKIKKLTKTT